MGADADVRADGPDHPAAAAMAGRGRALHDRAHRLQFCLVGSLAVSRVDAHQRIDHAEYGEVRHAIDRRDATRLLGDVPRAVARCIRVVHGARADQHGPAARARRLCVLHISRRSTRVRGEHPRRLTYSYITRYAPRAPGGTWSNSSNTT